MSNKISNTEELDFHYLLTLMKPLHNVKEFSWLPELFSIIGCENLLRLCKFAGGETIKIPTLYQVSDAIDSLQLYYDIYLTHSKRLSDVPDKLIPIVARMKEIFDADES